MFARLRPKAITAHLPILGFEASWDVSKQDRAAAWKLLVELTTRVSVNSLGDDDGSDKAALDSLHSLFATTRDVLKEHGLDTGADRNNGALPLATIAVRMLNEVIRPFTSCWHPQLDAHLAKCPPGTGTSEWERSRWGGDGGPLHVAFRRQLRDLREALCQYIHVLAKIAGTEEFGSTIETDAQQSGTTGGWVYATSQSNTNAAALDGSPRAHMTRWFDPKEVGACALLARKAEKHDTRNLSTAPFEDHSCRSAGEFWFDYAADMGDAFDPTMQVAWTLGRRDLTFVPRDRNAGQEQTLHRGSLLVLGGDEVYPYASDANYRNQLKLPYSHALEPESPAASNTDPSTMPPLVLSIPGNHDWYGGLEHWQAVFCAGDRFGGWTAPQKSSWWAVRLPHGWWMWGIDTFLNGTINPTQRTYFEAASKCLRPGDQVIVCTPVPLWRLRESHPHHLVEIDRFVDQYINNTGANATVFLSGDSHVFASYSRHRASGVNEQHVTSGGGGAFLHPTHNLAPTVPQTPLGVNDALVEPEPFVGGWFWPKQSASFQRNRGHLWQGIRDRQSVGLAALLAVLHALFGLVAGLTTRRRGLRAGWQSVPSILTTSVRSLPGAISLVVAAAILITIGILLAHANTAEQLVRRAARHAGLAHGLAQLFAMVAAATLAHWVTWVVFGWRFPQHAWAFAVPLGGLLGSCASVAVTIAYLNTVNRRYRVNDNEAFSAHHFADGKHFLRCSIDTQGRLTLRLVAIEQVQRGWAEARAAQEPWPPGAPVGRTKVAEIPWTRTVARHVPVIVHGTLRPRVSISVSDPDGDPDPTSAHASAIRVHELSAMLGDALLRAGFDIAYGGDHRADGYTRQLVEVGRESIGIRAPRIHNYLIAGIADEFTDHVEGINVIRVAVPATPSVSAPVHRAMELTAMRERMTIDCFARIAVGGRQHGHSGSAPGILEEAALSVRHHKPLIVVGGFGGMAATIGAAMRGGPRPVDASPLLDEFSVTTDLGNGLTTADAGEVLTTDQPHRIVALVLLSLATLLRPNEHAR